MSEKKFMRQGNMVGKFKVDIGTVYDNFGTFPKFFTLRPWALILYKMDHFFLFWLRYILLICFGDGALVFNFLSRTGNLHGCLKLWLKCVILLFGGFVWILGFFQVMQRQFLRTGITLGSFKLDVATVMSQQGTFICDCP